MNSQNRCFRDFCFNAIVLLLILGGCSVPTPSTSQLDKPALMPSIQPVMSSPIPPTWTPSPTPLPVVTPESPTPTTTSIPTLLPTLTISKGQALILDLLQNNGGCQLPCWWGFTPGKTNWQTVETFFVSLGKMPAKYSDPSMTNYSVAFQVIQDEVQIGQIYIVEDGLIEAISVSTGTVRDHKRVYGDTRFIKDLQHYMLPQMLSTYGQPEQVLLETFYSVPEGSFIPFNLLLFYPERGFLVQYYGPTERKGDRIRVCPRQADITLWLWSPKQERTLEDVARWGLGLPIEEVPSFRSLNSATGWSIEQFYQTFAQSDNQACLETPAEMWKNR